MPFNVFQIIILKIALQCGRIRLLPPDLNEFLLSHAYTINRIGSKENDCLVFSSQALLFPDVSLAVEQFRQLAGFIFTLCPNVMYSKDFKVTPM